jgi:hypothetical protein
MMYFWRISLQGIYPLFGVYDWHSADMSFGQRISPKGRRDKHR